MTPAAVWCGMYQGIGWQIRAARTHWPLPGVSLVSWADLGTTQVNRELIQVERFLAWVMVWIESILGKCTCIVCWTDSFPRKATRFVRWIKVESKSNGIKSVQLRSATFSLNPLPSIHRHQNVDYYWQLPARMTLYQQMNGMYKTFITNRLFLCRQCCVIFHRLLSVMRNLRACRYCGTGMNTACLIQMDLVLER